MRKKYFFLALLCVYICGVLIYSEPEWRTVSHTLGTRQAIEQFEKTKSSLTEKERKENDSYEQVEQYNERLYEEHQANLTEPWSYEQNSLDFQEQGIEEAMIGVLRVPSMDLAIPVYAGASQENMQKGAALLGETSFPARGTNINAVIAAHRGWKGIPMFRNIESVQIGDTFTMETSWDTLTYRVIRTSIIAPDELDAIQIQEGKNLVTLITCHPYTKNYQRYVVYGELEEEVDEEELSQDRESRETDGNKQEALETSSEDTSEQTDKEILEKELRWHRAGYVVIGITGLGILKKYRNTFKKKTR